MCEDDSFTCFAYYSCTLPPSYPAFCIMQTAFCFVDFNCYLKGMYNILCVLFSCFQFYPVQVPNIDLALFTLVMDFGVHVTFEKILNPEISCFKITFLLLLLCSKLLFVPYAFINCSFINVPLSLTSSPAFF